MIACRGCQRAEKIEDGAKGEGEHAHAVAGLPAPMLVEPKPPSPLAPPCNSLPRSTTPCCGLGLLQPPNKLRVARSPPAYMAGLIRGEGGLKVSGHPPEAGSLHAWPLQPLLPTAHTPHASAASRWPPLPARRLCSPSPASSTRFTRCAPLSRPMSSILALQVRLAMQVHPAK